MIIAPSSFFGLILTNRAYAVFLIFVKTAQSGPLTQGQAQSLVLNDIKSQNPAATVAVVSVYPSTLTNNSWNIVSSVVYNATKPCPTLFIQSYDYPATGLQPSTDNLYTRGCVIYGLSTAPTYVISSPYIAIARASSSNSIAVTNYVANTNPVYAYATFYANLSASITALTNCSACNKSFSNVWLVNYTGNSPSNLYVVLGQSGMIVANYTLPTT